MFVILITYIYVNKIFNMVYVFIISILIYLNIVNYVFKVLNKAYLSLMLQINLLYPVRVSWMQNRNVLSVRLSQRDAVASILLLALSKLPIDWRSQLQIAPLEQKQRQNFLLRVCFQAPRCPLFLTVKHFNRPHLTRLK